MTTIHHIVVFYDKLPVEGANIVILISYQIILTMMLNLFHVISYQGWRGCVFYLRLNSFLICLITLSKADVRKWVEGQFVKAVYDYDPMNQTKSYGVKFISIIYKKRHMQYLINKISYTMYEIKLYFIPAMTSHYSHWHLNLFHLFLTTY